ncbi:NAD(P)/FAD-dependent oxidoreductase [Amylibacter sp. IMCC11727]|uniref:NAD(P)/FAD-dependent oxidoreductase n=1 Tax=Amylibacter sp. IMCC11727 TaxID=3039851 RepID=UPI00244E0CA9|nr:NAD(P)/FAD-dependent oxidoreductase [Amylibacter sp. IMCC11727]WGI21666.1 NAD(P)/FAD-dependent oxidoreductase [Amylibacter sp. IMCC11727]
MADVQTVVVGAGVIGIAIARKLARSGHDVLILEAEEKIAQHTSSRNSQVVHAGIYYPAGSWRAKLCVAGKTMLYEYCKGRHVPFEITQKLIVAVEDAHVARLPLLVEKAAANGVTDLVMLSAADAMALEPNLKCKGAILSPSTGIVDAPAFILSLLGEAEAAGAMLALASPLQAARPVTGGFELQVGDAQRTTLTCKNLINAAGLGAWDVAKGVDGLNPRHVPRPYFAKGSWFGMAGRAPFQHLIYPVPDDESLGVHYTRDLGGGFRFGPDLEYLGDSELEYSIDAEKADAFENSVRRWWPDMPQGMFQPDSCGIRPRIMLDGKTQSDFMFSGPKDHGIDGLLQLFGFESPGLTSSLAIADVVAQLMGENMR